MSTIQMNLRLDEQKFIAAKQILADLGMNFSEAVNIFTSQVVAQKGLPFQIALPNEETKAAMQDVRTGENLETLSFEQFQQEVTLK
jgi:DNA-damage-inducible protein J